MSTIRPETDNKKQKRKRRRRNKELVELLNPSRLSNETPRPADKQGPKWETFAKERKGLLDRLIAKDKGNLEGFVKGKVFWVSFLPFLRIPDSYQTKTLKIHTPLVRFALYFHY